MNSEIKPPRRSIEQLSADLDDIKRWAHQTHDRGTDEIRRARETAEASEQYQVIERLGTTGLMFWSWQCQRELDALGDDNAIDYYRKQVRSALASIAAVLEREPKSTKART